jgi:hypothetical protein
MAQKITPNAASHAHALLFCPHEGCGRSFEFKFNDIHSKQAQSKIYLAGLHLHKSHGVKKSEAIRHFKNTIEEGEQYAIRSGPNDGRSVSQTFGERTIEKNEERAMKIIRSLPLSVKKEWHDYHLVRPQ